MRKTLLLLLIFSCLQINAQCWKTIVPGNNHNIALKPDGTLWGWGNNTNGQIGDGTTTSRNIPVNIGTANDWKLITAGWGHTVALKTDGSLWAWGYGILGQIGNGAGAVKGYNPVQQVGTAKDWQTIAAGPHYTIAIKTDGTLWAWGYNEFGQLGDGTTVDKNTPVQVGSDKDWESIAAGSNHTIAIKKDGTLWTWGENKNGKLGDGTTVNKIVPTQIGTATNWKAVAAGLNHTAAIKTDGTLWCWGFNGNGSLGDGTNTDKMVPTQIGTETNWKTIAVGWDNTVAIKTDGSLWSWGYNANGKLGIGSTANTFIPTQVGTAKDWLMGVSGYNHEAGLKTDGTIWTWGLNNANQLGDGTSVSKNVPITIGCPGSIVITTDQTDITCFGANNGSASVTSVVGGTAPYTYLWSNGKTTSSLTGLTAGQYSCAVTDAALLSTMKTFTIIQPTQLNVIVTNTNATCNSNNGSLAIIANGGTQPYQYAITPNFIYQSSNVFAGLSPGNYIVNVKDSKGCIFTSNTVIVTTNNTPPPTGNAQTFNNTATVADLKATGSNLKWFYSPTEGNPLAFSTVLQTGTYYVSQTINGCESIRLSVDVTIGPPLGNGQIPTNGLVAYYPFNGNANDLSGNGANGTVTAATLTSDRFGNSNTAYSFDGVNSYIDAVIPNIPKNNSSRTISGWFKTNDAFTVPNKNEVSIFNYGTLAKLQRLSLSIYSKGYLEPITGAGFSSDDFYINNFDYSNNDWYFFTLTYDGSKLSIFVNGKYVDQKAVNLNTIGNIFRIGQRISGDSVKEGFKGTIDDIAIWNRVLTAEEISALYTPAKPEIPYTLIPDANFEKKLIELGIDSGAADGKVLTSNISTITSLDVSNSNISNLSGIEDFVSLTKLDCGTNKLLTLNVSNNKLLTDLNCRYNNLSVLDLSANLKLTALDCIYNQITSLDVTKMLNLGSLLCTANQLTSLDVTNNLALYWFGCNGNKLITLDVSKNKLLQYLDCGFNQLTALDVSNNTALFYLNCYYNKLTALDISMLTELTDLACSDSKLSKLDVSKNTKLKSLLCEKMTFTTLDISNNTALKELYCGNGKLTTLNVSKNKALTILQCFNNQLSDLNIKNGTNTLLTTVNFIQNPDLICIQVDDVTFANTNWATKKDTLANFNTNCLIDFVLLPDPNFEQKLIDLGIDTDGLNGKITTANITAITSLDLSNSNIQNLTGIEYFTALTFLDCSDNQLKTLDVSKNLALETLNASSNQITTLDFSKNTKLKIVYITNNPLISVNLQNGNNRNFVLPSSTDKKTAALYTSFLGLTTLSCIKVDDPAYSNANWSKIKEPTTIYSATCSTLGIDDSVFNKAVLSPNPTKGEVNINNIALEKATVYNSLGQLVRTFKLNSANTDNTINLSGLPKGVYYVYLINQDTASAKKVIVE
ncbi:T9SS type A sorting domain-containing protein [Flavobacterium psychroterrae]|uniref:T9SS type A sorting domain-containing protein n=1 Tax=Flavobacterium psychroterrae TaxID=2133767 RepID=A0ABS5P7N6_9FLAO|nr:LamG-like jellyroll fold domain-containing protein [Flavobacterium psychroterrae]MBS7230291.1 T9SS type A sorting domain-containing protein [Flavobacterium psychroterrae]